MNYAPLTWYEQEYLTCKAHLEATPRAPRSLRLPASKVFHEDIVRLSYRSVHEITKLITQRFQVYKVNLATAYANK
jgi:hypothetical protein